MHYEAATTKGPLCLRAARQPTRLRCQRHFKLTNYPALDSRAEVYNKKRLRGIPDVGTLFLELTRVRVRRNFCGSWVIADECVVPCCFMSGREALALEQLRAVGAGCARVRSGALTPTASAWAKMPE